MNDELRRVLLLFGIAIVALVATLVADDLEIIAGGYFVTGFCTGLLYSHTTFARSRKKDAE